MVNEIVTSANPTRDEMLRRWHAQATKWLTEQAFSFLGTHKAPATAGVIMDHLDSLAAPAGYEMSRNDYIKRYHLVRRTLNALAKAGQLVTTPVLNTRGRNSTAYALPGTLPDVSRVRRRKRTTSQYEVLVEGPSEIKKALETFLENAGLGNKPFEAFIVKK